MLDEPVGPRFAPAQAESQRPLAPIIEMAVGLECVADAAMDLDILPRCIFECIDSGQPGRGGGDGQRVGIIKRSPGSEISVGTRQFDGDRDVGEFVLDGLIAGQRAAEYLSIHRIIPRHQQAGVSSTHCFECGLYGGTVEQLVKYSLRRRRLQQLRRGGIELDRVMGT